MAAFFLQDLDQGVKVVHTVVDHEGSRARSKLIALLWMDGPGSRAGNRLALGVSPGEGRAAPDLDIDSQVPLVPGLQGWSVFGLEEDAADASDAFHASVFHDITTGPPLASARW